MARGRGRGRASATASQVPPRGRGRSLTAAGAGPSNRGRSAVRGRGGRGARGRGGRGGAAALPPQAGSHSAEVAHEFIVNMHRSPCTWLRLPDSFAATMADRAPLGLWVQADGCCNGPSWVATELTPSGFMFLRQGWKSFALARGLKRGHVLQFKYDGAATLFVKIFGLSGSRLECCAESEDGSYSGSSSEDDSSSGAAPSGGGGGDGDPPPRQERGRGLRLGARDDDSGAGTPRAR